MAGQKIRSVISFILFLFLAIFFVATCLLGFQNYPAVKFVLIVAPLLILLCVLWPAKPATDIYHPLKDYKVLSMLALLTLIPRGLWIAGVHTIQISDFKLYFRLATLLADGVIKYQSYIRLYPHVIGYPFVLSILFRIFDNTVLTAQVFNLLLYVGIVLAIFVLAAQFLNKPFAILTAVIVALWPSTLFYTTMVSTEALFTFLLILSIGLFYSIKNITRLPAGLPLFGFLGIVVAMTNAVRPFGPLFLLAILFYYFVFVTLPSGGIRSWVIKIVLFGFLCLSYFLTTNFIHYMIVRTVQGSVAKTFLGYSVLVGSNSASGGTWNEGDSLLQSNLYQNGKVHPDKVNQILLGYAIERIKSAPKEFITLQLSKNKTMWQDDTFGINWNKVYRDEENPGRLSLQFMEWITPISNLYYYTILICCILGCFIGIWRRETGLIAFIGLIMLGTILIFILTEVQMRYHYYALPLFALSAGYGLGEFNKVVQTRKQRKIWNAKYY